MTSTDNSWLAKAGDFISEEVAKLGEVAEKWAATSVPEPSTSDWSTSPPSASTEAQMTFQLIDMGPLGFRVATASPLGGGFIEAGKQQNLTAGKVVGSPVITGSPNDVSTVRVKSVVWDAKEYIEALFTDDKGTIIVRIVGLWSGGGTGVFSGSGPFLFPKPKA